MSEHVVPVRVYLMVFAVLLLLTAATTWVAFIDLGRLSVVIMLAIAVVKATLVVLFFMHVLYSDRLTWLVVSSGFAILMLLVVFVAGDMIAGRWRTMVRRRQRRCPRPSRSARRRPGAPGAPER
jgi:cytochrome c oxidase subunit 4